MAQTPKIEFASRSDVLDIDWYLAPGTIGQPDASGPLTGGTLSLTGGFWPGAHLPVVDCLGDANHSGVVNIDDLVIVITTWGMCPSPCPPTVRAI